MAFSALIAAADRAVAEHLGSDAVLYAPSAGGAVTVRGMFDAAYVLAEVGEAGLSTTAPAVFLRLSDLPSDPDMDDPTLTIRGVVYRPRECKPDGLGGVTILLHRL